MEDLTVMGTILGMTDCAKTAALLSCADECGRSFVTFAHDGLRSSAAQLKSATIRQLLHENLDEAYGHAHIAGIRAHVETVAKCTCDTPGAGLAGNNSYTCDDKST